MDFIRITALTDIGNNIAYSSLIPVVDMAGTPTTKKANLQIVGNLILNGAGGSYFAPAARSVLAQSVTNAAQPNITSVGTLSNLVVSGNVNLGAVGNITITGGTAGQLLSTNGNGNLSWVSQPGGTYGNSNVASYLPTYTGTVGANRISSTPASGSNVEISANGAVFNFAQGGALYWPASAGNQWVIEPNIDNEFEIKSTSNVVISTDISNANSHFTFDSDGIFTAPSNVNLLGSRLNVGPDAANAANLLNPTLVIANSGSQYIQAAIINNDPNGSADLSADGAGGGDEEAWTDMGFAGYTFNDANYTITEPGDGYLFVQGYANGLGGNMVLATGDHSNTADIVFATGGFLANNEFARIEHSNNLFHLTRAGSGIQFSDGSIQTTAGGGGGTGNITFSNTTISTSIANADINLVGSNSGNIHVDSNNHIFLHVDDTIDPHGGLEMTWARTSNGVTQTAGISINTDFGNTELATGNVQIVACSNLANGLSNSSWTFGTSGAFYLPGDGEKSIFTGPNSEMVLHSDTDIRIITDIYDSSRQFVFDQFGDFFAPGNVTLDGTSVLVGQGANTLGLADATLVISSNSNAYVQAVINNVSDAGSADWVAQGRLGSDLGGYVDLGFNSSGFGDPEYSAMGPGDGYLYTEGYADGQAPLPTGGNLVIGTGSQGLTRDIIFTTGGHTTDNIIARFSDANNLFELSRANSGIKFPDGSIQTTAAGNGGLPLSNGNSIINIATLDGNITLDSNGNVFTFGTDGDVTFPDGTVLGQIEGANTFGFYSNDANMQFLLEAASNNWVFDGANSNFTTPSNLVIGANGAGGSSIYQFDAPLQVLGEGANSALIVGWTANSSGPENVAAIAFNNPLGNGAGNLVIGVGNNATTVNYWNFDNTGNLILPGNGYISNPINSSLDPLNPNVSTMIFTPDSGYSSQSLVLDPTAPGHIHLRAPGANIDEPYANIFLGGEDSSFEVGYYNGSAPNLYIHSGGNTWTFSNDGTTTFPTGNITSNTSLQFTTTFANVKTVEYQTAGVWDLYVEDSITGSNTAASRLNVSFKDNLIDKPQVYIENTKESDGIALRWTFDENGNLNFPRDVAGNTDPFLTISGGASPRILSEDVSLAGPANLEITALNTIFTGASGSAIKIYPDDGEVASDGNLQIWSNVVGNTQYSWTFDTDGNLTLPGNISLSTANGIIDSTSNLEIYSGTDGNNGAYLALGSGSGNIGGDISIISGEGTVTTGGNIILQGGIGNTKGGNATLQGGSGLGAGGNGGDVEIVGGIANVGGLSGNITLYSGVNQWKFDNSGNLTIPSNTVKINFANGSPAFANLVQWTTAPVANTSAGTAGQAAYDSGGNLYVCVSTNTWAKFSGTTSW